MNLFLSLFNHVLQRMLENMKGNVGLRFLRAISEKQKHRPSREEFWNIPVDPSQNHIFLLFFLAL